MSPEQCTGCSVIQRNYPNFKMEKNQVDQGEIRSTLKLFQKSKCPTLFSNQKESITF